MTDLRQAAQAVVERWDSPKWEWSQQGPTADLMASLRTALKQQQAEPVQKPPYPGWKPGCQVCGAHGAMGYVCPRSDCPTKVTCGGVV